MNEHLIKVSRDNNKILLDVFDVAIVLLKMKEQKKRMVWVDCRIETVNKDKSGLLKTNQLGSILYTNIDIKEVQNLADKLKEIDGMMEVVK